MLLFSDFNKTWIFLTDFFLKKAQIWNFTKIHPVGAELFHADGRTDGHDKAKSSFSQFSEQTLKTAIKFLFLFLKNVWKRLEFRAEIIRL